ncbi:MAG: ATP-dependent DNA helicase RecG, partial [Candidatus Puniceispirillaceae bacterium]
MRISRPPQLFGLFASTTDLPGIGARLAEILKKRIGTTVIDILRHLPVSIINRQISLDLDACENGQIVTVDAEIKSADIPPANTSRPARIVARTSHHNIELIFFHARADYLKKMLPIGERRLISGRLDRYDGKLQIGHPDYMLSPEQAHTMPKIEPVYPLSAGLKPKILRNAIAAGLKRVPALEEWIPAELLTQKGWPDFASAMNMAHHPEKEADLMAHAPARARLAYDELLANQIALHMIRRQTRHDEAGRTLKSAGTLREQIIHSLPYEMTGAQKRVMSEILADMSAPTRMLRLLQGDVGAGKTLIALLAMVEAAEAGTQAALLAPTEILAKQHFETISAILADTPLSTGLLIGAMKASDKTRTNEQLKSGEMQIIIGTHALLSDDVAFADLGLAVVDEQHRFGVRQRLVLGQKGKGTDVLVMTATPIPRTLSMTAYGDLTTSYLDEKPK